MHKANCMQSFEKILAHVASVLDTYTQTKKVTSDFHGTVSINPVKMSQQN